MSSWFTLRRQGLLAMLGGIVGILYAPFYALAYFSTEDGATQLNGSFVEAWTGALGPVLEPFVTFASPEVVYLTYGKAMTFVVFGWIAGLLAIHALQAAHAGRLERWGFRIALVACVLALIGSISAYWVGSLWWDAVGISFIVFMIPGLLLISVGFPLFGIGTLRAKRAPRVGAWLLIAGGLPGIIALSALFGQLTMGMLLLNLGWIVLGYSIFSGQRVPAEQRSLRLA